MNVKWEDVKEDFARKDAEIESLKVMNAELVKALTNLINDIGSKHSIHIENNIGGSTRRALNCAKIVLANSEELNHEEV